MSRRDFLALMLALLAAPAVMLKALAGPTEYWVMGVSLLGVDTILAPGALVAATSTYTLTPTATATLAPTGTPAPPGLFYFPIVGN